MGVREVLKCTVGMWNSCALFLYKLVKLSTKVLLCIVKIGNK